VAIVQISRITQRSGLQQDLPQLAGAEFGWSVDQRRLFIGNGTLEEGAPVVGNTEILTEFSDLLAIAPGGYTYRGEAAGYEVQTGPTPSDPISMSIQSWMDQWATVLDFGAVGDGTTDDYAAIQAAINSLPATTGGGVYFPTPSVAYKITASLFWNNKPVTLYGDNAAVQPNSGTKILVASTVTGVVIQNGSSGFGANSGLENLHFVSQDTTNTSANGATIQCTAWRVTNCSFENFGNNGLQIIKLKLLLAQLLV
jgi:hypothetical protein